MQEEARIYLASLKEARIDHWLVEDPIYLEHFLEYMRQKFERQKIKYYKKIHAQRNATIPKLRYIYTLINIQL